MTCTGILGVGGCWIRRWYYKKEKGLVKVDRFKIAMPTPSKNHVPYILFVSAGSAFKEAVIALLTKTMKIVAEWDYHGNAASPAKSDFTVENKRGIMVLPKNCMSYILFIPVGCALKKVLKMLGTLAEVVARW